MKNMEKKLLEVFLYKKKLKFSEIQEKTGVSSNKLAYHLKKLLSENLIAKDVEGNYELSESKEHIIPYITEKQAILPVLLIALEKEGKYFLYNREKRPYNGLLSLPGGRILVGESIEKAARRIMMEKFGLDCRFKGIRTVSLEHVRKKGKIIHSFLLIFVSVSTADGTKYHDIEENRKKMIKSDYLLLKKYCNSNLKIPVINSFAS